MLIREEKGITLIDMLVSIAILSVLALSFYQILSTFSENFETQDAIAEMQEQGRFTADLISREIRQTGYDPTGGFFNGGAITDGNPDNNCNSEDPAAAVERILEAGATVFHYLADLDEDGVAGGENEQVRYEWVGSLEDGSGKGNDICGVKRDENALYRNTGGGMQQVSSDIVALNFQYFDDRNIEIPTPMTSAQRATILKVILTLTARTDRPDKGYPENGGYRTRTFVYDIWLQNA